MGTVVVIIVSVIGVGILLGLRNGWLSWFGDAPAAVGHPFGEGSRGPLADGSMPSGFPIKGNRDSMLYHRTDSRSYGATVAEVWFDTPDSAQGAGFSLAGSHPQAVVPSL